MGRPLGPSLELGGKGIKVGLRFEIEIEGQIEIEIEIEGQIEIEIEVHRA